MGNFSRDTFDPSKNYVGVRLQQGVPLVDADWNELNDVIRHELYQGLGTIVSDGVELSSSPLPSFLVMASLSAGTLDSVELPAIDNDFYVFPGRAIVGGQPIHLPFNGAQDIIRYSTQPWTSPARANQDGVDVIPPLTTPQDDRTDIVYLDVWEREVSSTEDTNLINDQIGIETCVRLKREVAVRVAEGIPEGTSTLPHAPKGHIFMPLALLNRDDGEADLSFTGRIQDIRPEIRSRGITTLIQRLDSTIQRLKQYRGFNKKRL